MCGLTGGWLFSDILTPLPAIGIPFEIDENKGPLIDQPIRSLEQVLFEAFLRTLVTIHVAATESFVGFYFLLIFTFANLSQCDHLDGTCWCCSLYSEEELHVEHLSVVSHVACMIADGLPMALETLSRAGCFVSLQLTQMKCLGWYGLNLGGKWVGTSLQKASCVRLCCRSRDCTR